MLLITVFSLHTRKVTYVVSALIEPVIVHARDSCGQGQNVLVRTLSTRTNQNQRGNAITIFSNGIMNAVYHLNLPCANCLLHADLFKNSNLASISGNHFGDLRQTFLRSFAASHDECNACKQLCGLARVVFVIVLEPFSGIKRSQIFD